jgi:hypothetical protein
MRSSHFGGRGAKIVLALRAETATAAFTCSDGGCRGLNAVPRPRGWDVFRMCWSRIILAVENNEIMIALSKRTFLSSSTLWINGRREKKRKNNIQIYYYTFDRIIFIFGTIVYSYSLECWAECKNISYASYRSTSRSLRLV